MRKVELSKVHIVCETSQAGKKIWLATKEGACWVSLEGDLLLFAEDLGTPEALAGDLMRMKHLATLVGAESDRLIQLAELARSLLTGRKV